MNDSLTREIESLIREIESLIRAGATYVDAPTIGEEVLDLIDAFFARFLSYTEQERHAHVLWCAHTWLMDCWENTPRILFISPEAGCGKTRALTVTGCFVPRPDHVADLTPAAFYSAIDEALEHKGGRPTIMFDEFDAASTAREMRGLINTGHSRNGGVSRKIGGKTKHFKVYAPMALAGKMGIFDVPETIRTRSIVIPMQKPLPGKKVERWIRRQSAVEAESLCWLLRLWIELIHGYALDYVGPDHPMLPEDIEDRDADVWEPPLAVAELAGGHWPQRARVAAVAGVAAVGGKAVPSPGIDLLSDIQVVFDSSWVEKIHTVNLLAELAKIDQRWRRLDPKGLSRILNSYGVTKTNKDQRIGGKVTKGYRREYFEDAWARWLSPPATPATGEVDDDE